MVFSLEVNTSCLMSPLTFSVGLFNDPYLILGIIETQIKYVVSQCFSDMFTKNLSLHVSCF